MVLLLQVTAIGFFLVVLAAWIAESYKTGNRLWVWMREVVVEYIYDDMYLGVWRAMMRHHDDPALTYNGRHFK